MRILPALLLAIAALPAFAARWEPCPSACAPPATATGLSARLPLYAGPVKWGGDARGGMWLWQKTTSVTCSAAQRNDASDKFACDAAIGAVMLATPRFRARAGSLTSALPIDATIEERAAAANVYAPPHCPLRLPDSSYAEIERDRCAALDMAISEAGAD